MNLTDVVDEYAFADRQKPKWCRLPLRVPRGGIAFHYDGSSTDAGSVTWLAHDSRCKAGYNWLVLDDGKVVELGGPNVRAWHMGYCRPSPEFADRGGYRWPNSYFYGISAATNAGTPATDAQIGGMARLALALFDREGWSLERDVWRLTSHKAEAVYGPKDPRAGQRGRKSDPPPAFTVSQVWGRMMEMSR